MFVSRLRCRSEGSEETKSTTNPEEGRGELMPSYEITAVAASNPEITLSQAEQDAKRAEAMTILARRFNCQFNAQGHLVHDSLDLAAGPIYLCELEANVMIRQVEHAPTAC
jgi:hypothetical protein